jgi:uncharacterized membrane protein YphA (DoxX/SURF4 family)
MNWIIIMLQGLLALAMLGSGALKIAPGDTEPKKNFKAMRLPLRWLAPIGWLEVLVGITLLSGFFFPQAAAFGALIGLGIMAGAVGAHIVQDTNGFHGYPAVVLALISGAVLLGHWSALGIF